MKILAFSDLHGDRQAARLIVEAGESADVVIGAGDFATRGEGALDTLEILRDCANPVVLVHGNHDVPSEIALYCQDWEQGHYLHGSSVSIEGQPFFGLGGEIPLRGSNFWNVTETESKAAELLENCPQNAILITHTPPLGVADLQKNGEHEGSAAIRAAITNHEPKLLLCGHIHNAWGMQGRVGATGIHNLGPTINWFDM